MAVRCAGAEPGRNYRLGVLLPHPRDVPVNLAFLEQFRHRGFIEGKNLTVEWRAFGEHVDLMSQYTAELVESQVDVIGVTVPEALLVRADKVIE
jgi:putative tryptophan/tyrosine transport system substrate-binding protein